MATCVKVESCEFQINTDAEIAQIKVGKHESPSETKEELIDYFEQDGKPCFDMHVEDPLTPQQPIKYENYCMGNLTSSLSEHDYSTTEVSRKQFNKEAKKGYLCTFESCAKTFTHSGHLAAHLRVHTGEKPYICTQENCGKAFKTSNALRVHLKGHTGEKTYFCGDCGKGFVYCSSLNSHQKLHSDLHPFQCDVPDCNRFFKRRMDVNYHKKRDHLQERYACTYEGCGKVYNRIESLAFHMRSHSEDKPFKCHHEGCPKGFWHKHDYIEHMRVHKGDKPFSCDYKNCGKKYTSKRQLKLHQTEHENRVFVCTFNDVSKAIKNGEATEVCAKVFKNQRLLSEHMRRHKSIKRHKCDRVDCGKDFFTKQELTRHLKMHARTNT